VPPKINAEATIAKGCVHPHQWPPEKLLEKIDKRRINQNNREIAKLEDCVKRPTLPVLCKRRMVQLCKTTKLDSKHCEPRNEALLVKPESHRRSSATEAFTNRPKKP
jgi:hypothetical protein